MHYTDGVGHASDGTTRHGSHTFGAGDMGIQNGYPMTDKLSHLLGKDGHASNFQNCQQGLQTYRQKVQVMRRNLLSERFWDNWFPKMFLDKWFLYKYSYCLGRLV